LEEAGLPCEIGHGDLLAEAGFIYRTNAELMEHFNPYDPLNPDESAEVDHDYGLDAAWVAPWDSSVWFSTEECFYDRYWGWVSDGDVLCENGWVIRRNLTLLAACGPLEDLANFGLDALHYFPWAWPVPADDVVELDEP
jgi:hypothetical protein